MIHGVEGKSVNSALSLEGVTDTGHVPTAKFIDSEIDSEVIGASVC